MRKRNSVALYDRIYRYFFIGGIITMLTLGCMWGAVNLLLIGMERTFHGIDYSWVLAHGHAIVFGFVGFFIMGFIYHALPRLKKTILWNPSLALSVLPLMASGILLQSFAHVMAPHDVYLHLGIVAGAIQIIAVLIFALVVQRTLRQTVQRDYYDSFIYAALGWFVLALILNPIIFILFESPATQEVFLFRVSTFNIPYRDIQMLGIAMVMILGVSLHILPHAYGLRLPSLRWQKFVLWGSNGAILMGIVTFLAGMVTENHWWHAASVISYLILLTIAIGTPIQYRLFRKNAVSNIDRGLKFIRIAHIWFIVAMVMLLFGPYYMFGIYLPMTGGENPFSHAYFGAYRHTLTVGFITMMIVGVSAHAVPAFSKIDVKKTNSLLVVFILLNLGNLLRISSQIITDFHPEAFNIMGFSGFIEVTAMVLWGIELIRNISAGKRKQTHQLQNDDSSLHHPEKRL